MSGTPCMPSVTSRRFSDSSIQYGPSVISGESTQLAEVAERSAEAGRQPSTSAPSPAAPAARTSRRRRWSVGVMARSLRALPGERLRAPGQRARAAFRRASAASAARCSSRIRELSALPL